MFEQAKDWCNNNNYEVVGGYISPVSDNYHKKHLVPAKHRAAMCELSLKNTPWIKLDTWELFRDEYTPTANVLKRFFDCFKIKVLLLCGADFVNSFNTHGLWSKDDIDKISKLGILCIERRDYNISEIIRSNEILYNNKSTIYIVKQDIDNNISSTHVRTNIRKNLSVKYLVSDDVIDYINKHNLYKL